MMRQQNVRSVHHRGHAQTRIPYLEITNAQLQTRTLITPTRPQGWYDRKTFEVRTIVDIAFCGVMGPPGGGRSAVTNPTTSTLSLEP